MGGQARFAGHAGILALTVLMASGPGGGTAAAYDPPAGTVEYAIHHSKYDRIGTHSVSFSHAGDDLIVDVVIHVKVKLLFLTVHSLEAERREVWRGGRLYSYRSRTDENGKLANVTATTEGDAFVIKGPNGTQRTDTAVFPTHPWNPAIVDRTRLMDTKTGEVLTVSTMAGGDETIEVAGKSVPTRRYVMTGDLERELWFDRQGNWIQLRFKRDGASLTFTRTTPLP